MDSNADNQKDTCLMKAHFLKPYVTSIDGPVAELPRYRSSVSSSDLKDSFSRISFTGFWFPDGDFRSWAEKMEALYEPTWRRAGIFEAIKASTYKIPKNQSLIQALVEKWCPETKSFVFPWGEATITLEDVMVLLGFSVLGSPAFAPLESSEMRDSVEKLEKVRLEILDKVTKGGRVSQFQWISSFRGRGDSMEEHEAFIAMWLSHFVFPPKSRRCISRYVLPIAVRLARGERIALAPPVLASIYRDLGQIRAFARDKSTQIIKSLFKLVQVWAWERFRNIRPEAREIRRGEPRIARWSCLNKRKESLSFDDFDWRPYTKPLDNWIPPRFYLEEAMWITVDDNLDDEFVSFARCMRVSQLVGVGFVEDYYPNRVAMQFGLSQDLPGLVSDHSSFTEKEAWDDYNKSLDGLKIYVPSRLATTSVTARYRDWWLKSVSEFLDSSGSSEPFNARNTADHDDVSPKVLSLGQVLQNLGAGFPLKLTRCKKRRIAKNMRSEIKKDKSGDCGGSASTEVPLGELFQKELAKRTRLRNQRTKRPREDDDENRMDCYGDITIAQLYKSRKKTGGDASESLGKRNLILSNENNSLNPPLGANGGIVDIVVSLPEARQICNGEIHVNGNNAEKETMIDDGNKEVECLLNEDGEKQKSNEKLCSEANIEDDERLKQRKLAVYELASNLEARMMKVEKTLAEIREWKTRRNQIKNGVSA
ncbi:uncharacterized protein LOC18010448 [Eutrema salsugineum]|uniref:uncharacterized protein LOC18010448 n=1 Tax=Eutrema salsugineum TaxID=72664 RepID=UPI000CED633F|nr:uncharacterized protein LOC18010448 [Eutrema salsugineum]